MFICWFGPWILSVQHYTLYVIADFGGKDNYISWILSIINELSFSTEPQNNRLLPSYKIYWCFSRAWGNTTTPSMEQVSSSIVRKAIVLPLVLPFLILCVATLFTLAATQIPLPVLPFVISLQDVFAVDVSEESCF